MCKNLQTSHLDIYNGVSESMKENNPKLIRLPEKHLDFYRLIPMAFRGDFYCKYGRSHVYELESMIKALVLPLIPTIITQYRQNGRGNR